MTVAQKVAFELVAIDGPASGFADAYSVAAVLADAIQTIPGPDRSRLLLVGGWESASRGAGVTMQLVGERLGIADQFQGVDQITVRPDGSFEFLDASRADVTSFPCALEPRRCSVGRLAICRSHAITRRSAWRICAR